MQERYINNLISVLNKEKEYYLHIKELAEKKGEILINNEIDSLKNVLTEDEQIINKIKELEEKRKDILTKVLIFYNHEDKDKNITFKKLIDIVPSDYQEELHKLRDELLAILNELQAFNAQNSLLLDNAITLNEVSFKLLLEDLEDDLSYNKNKIKKTNKKHMLDKKA